MATRKAPRRRSGKPSKNVVDSSGSGANGVASRRKATLGRQITNGAIGRLLRQYASVLALEGANRFKVKAYRRAAETVETFDGNIAQFVSSGTNLTTLPSIGIAIARVIEQIVRTGTLPRLTEAVSTLAPGLIELAAKPGLDPKKVVRVYNKLGVKNLDELRKAVVSGQVRELFGTRLDFQLRQALDNRPRLLLWAADKLVPGIEEYLRSSCGVERVAPIGSLRRRKETIADLGFLVAGKTAAAIFQRFMRYGPVISSKAVNKNEMLFDLSGGQTVRLVWTDRKNWGLALLLNTGSHAHVEALREIAADRDKSLTVRSLSKAAASEEEIYHLLGLKPIAPELREGRGEVEAAARDQLPTLVELADIVGDLHMHTTASDGANSIDEMAAAAAERGYRYIAITDHSQSLKIANGLSEKRLYEQIKAIDRVNSRPSQITILKSAEVDILEDGRLDYPDALLKELDLTICSIHSRFALDPNKQTERIMRAMDNRYFSILGHATGRLLLQREGYEPDIERLIAHAKDCGCFFEINSSPNRLDLSDTRARMAKEAGVKVAVNTDAHSISELRFIAAGLNQARRGWLEAADVLNTHPLPKLKSILRRVS